MVQQWPSELYGSGYQGVRAIWSLTSPRSGTLYLAWLLDHCAGLKAAHEPHPVLLMEGRRALEGDELDSEGAKRLIYTARVGLVEHAYYCRSTYVEISCSLTHLAPAIKAAFPESRYVHLIRRPQEYVTSCLAQGFFSEGPRSHYWPMWEGLEPWQRAVRYWALTHRRALELEQEWGSETVYRQRAEDLWREGDALEQLLRWVAGVPDGVQLAGCGRHRGTWGGPRNASTQKPLWDPEWDEYLRDEAGDVMEEVGYGW